MPWRLSYWHFKERGNECFIYFQIEEQNTTYGKKKKKETKPDRVSGLNYTNFSNIEVTKVCVDTAIFKMDNQQGPTA